MFRIGSSILKDKSKPLTTSTDNDERNRNVGKPGDRAGSPIKVQKVTPTSGLKFRTIPVKRKHSEPQLAKVNGDADEGSPRSPVIQRYTSVRDHVVGKIMHGRISDKVQDHQARNQSGRSDTSTSAHFRGYGDDKPDLVSGNPYNRNRILEPLDPSPVACSSISKNSSSSVPRNHRLDFNSNPASENYRGGGERLPSAYASNTENRNPNGRPNLGASEDIKGRFESQQAKFVVGGHGDSNARGYGNYRGHDHVNDRDLYGQVRSSNRQLDYGQHLQREFQQPSSTSRGFRDKRARDNYQQNHQKGYTYQEDYGHGHGVKRSMQHADVEDYIEPDIAALINEYRQVMKQRFQAKKARIERNFTVVRTPEILFKTQEILAATRKHKATKYEAALTQFRTKVDDITKTHKQNAVMVQKMSQSIQKGVKKMTEEIQSIKIGIDECIGSMQEVLQDYTIVMFENKKKSITKLDKKFHKWEEKVIETVQTSTTDILQIYLKHL